MMRWVVVIAVLVCLGGVGMMCVAEEGTRVVFRTVGEVDGALLHRVLQFCAENTQLEIVLGEPLETDASTLHEIAKKASAELEPSDGMVVVFCGRDTGESVHGVSLYESRAAAVSVPPLIADQPDEETKGRRLERQAMQSIGLLVGLTPCPNPQCVMWPYSNMEELDAKGRNLCPPCFDRLLALAKEKGLKVVRFASAEEETSSGAELPEEETELGEEPTDEESPVEEQPSFAPPLEEAMPDEETAWEQAPLEEEPAELEEEPAFAP